MTRHPGICRFMAWMMTAALLVWVVEGMTLTAAVWMVRTGRVDPDRLGELGGLGLIPLMILAQAGAVLLLGLGALVRHGLRAEPLSSPAYEWLATLLTGILVFATAALLLHALPTFQNLIHADTHVPIRHMTGHSVQERQYWFSEEMPRAGAIRQAFKEVNGETGLLLGMEAFSALGLLILNVRGAWEKRHRHRQHGVGRRGGVPPWRLPRTKARSVSKGFHEGTS